VSFPPRCVILAPLPVFRRTGDVSPPDNAAWAEAAFDVLSAIAGAQRLTVMLVCSWLPDGSVDGPTDDVLEQRVRDIGALFSLGLSSLPAALQSFIYRTTLVACLGRGTSASVCKRFTPVFDVSLRAGVPRARIQRADFNIPPSHDDSSGNHLAFGPGGVADTSVLSPDAGLGSAALLPQGAALPSAGATISVTPTGNTNGAEAGQACPRHGAGITSVIRFDDDAREVLSLLASQTGDPVLGVGRMAVGCPSGTDTMVCAASTVAQLLLPSDASAATLDSATFRVAASARLWGGLACGTLVGIADTWIAAVIALRPVGPVPRLAVFRVDFNRRVGDRTSEGRYISVISAPRAWDGTYVAAVGSGSHFDPIWWIRLTHSSAVAPGGIRTLVRTPTLNADMGPAACVLLSLGAQFIGRCAREDALAGAERPLEDDLDYDQGVLLRALSLMVTTAGSASALLTQRMSARKIDAVLVCQQPDWFPLSGSGDDAYFRQLLLHALWAPSPGATYLVVIACDQFAWLAGIIGASSTAARSISGFAANNQGAAGPRIL